MIYVSHVLPVNNIDSAPLTRAQLWDGLVMKANNALPFVAAMSECTVTDRISDTVFDRDIVVNGQASTERITLQEPKRVVFTRIAGSVLGTIANEIEGDDDDLRLRFSFALVIPDVEPGSAEESAYAEGMKSEYLKAVESTIATVRRMTGPPTA
ncbi:SRPBCC family protein [Paeniglutamicibacter sp. NPDC012692]|uniref:SRPBCC family protein n=1 Tax=Paeniglutamicibacter sp. NPDC012692 TaxID=3364388 RepID=UPI0036C33D37